jgi:hypothetical protein
MIIGSEISYGQVIERPPDAAPLADHPAKFSDQIISHAFDMLWPYVRRGRVQSMLDPFAGVGRCHIVASNLTESTPHRVVSVGVEIQPRWAAHDRRTIVGNVLDLPRTPVWRSGFDCVFTSPCYGNRMADHQDARERCKTCRGTGEVVHYTERGPMPDQCAKCGGTGRNSYQRNTYTHTHGEPLDPANAGRLQWGKEYRRFHRAAWPRVVAQLRYRGLFLLNISDHLRKVEGVQQRQPVSRFHHDTLTGLGLVLIDRRDIKTPRNRQGANGDARVEAEHLLMYDKRRRSS